MSLVGDDSKRLYLREGLLLLGFVLLLAAATFSVVLPELSREPDNPGAGRAAQSTPTNTPAAAN